MWRRYLRLAQGFTAADRDGIVKYTAHELRHVCASLMIPSGATDMQVVYQMGNSKVETTKNIYGHLFAQDRADVLAAMNQAVSRCTPTMTPNPAKWQVRRPDRHSDSDRPPGDWAPGGLSNVVPGMLRSCSKTGLALVVLGLALGPGDGP